MANPRAADDYPVIRARLKELRRERKQMAAGEMAQPDRRPLTGEQNHTEKELRPLRVPGRFSR